MIGRVAIWAETIRRCHIARAEMKVEALTGDFKGVQRDIDAVCDARPEIISHNMETVKRMHPTVQSEDWWTAKLVRFAEVRR